MFRRLPSAFRTLVKAVTAAVALSAAVPLSPAAEAQEQLKFGTVRFVASAPDMTFLPMLLAAEYGLDKQMGYSSAFTYAASPIGIKAMIAGDFDFSLSVSSNLAAAVQGAPVRVVAVHARKSLFSLYGKNEITSLKELEGQTVGVSAMGDATHIATMAAMKAAGVDLSKVTFVALGQANVPAALITGTVSAGLLVPPRELMAEKTGKFHSLGFMGDYLVVPGMGMATSEDSIKKKSEMVQAVVHAARHAQDMMRTDKARTSAFMAKLLKLSEEDAQIAWDRLKPHLTEDISIPADLQQTMMTNQMQITKPRTQPTIDQVFDMQFAQRAK